MLDNTAEMRGDQIITGQRRKVKKQRAKQEKPAKNMPAADNTPVAKGQVQETIAQNVMNRSPTQPSLSQNSTAQPQVSKIQPPISNTLNETPESIILPSTKAQRRRERRRRVRDRAQDSFEHQKINII
jgi:hypothetical protein